MSGTQIYASTWTLNASGSWSDGGDWLTQVPVQGGGYINEPVVPGANDAVALNPGGTTPFTVTYNTTDEVYSLGSSFYNTLAVQSGVLTIEQGGQMDGAVSLTGGTIDAQNGWAVSGGFNDSAGTKMEVDAGQLSVSTGTLDGTITGGGKLYLIGGDSFVLGTTLSVTTGTLELGVNGDGFGSLTTLDANLSYTGTFRLDNYSGNDAVLYLNHHTASISGTSYLDAEISGPGTFAVTGTAYVADGGYSYLTVAGGAVFVDEGNISQYQSAALSSLLRITAHSTWDIVADTGIGNIGSATITNAGLFEKTGGTNISYIAANITNTGTIADTSGTLEINGTLSNGGLLSGDTVLVTGAFISTGSIDVAELSLSGGGGLGGHVTGSGEIDLRGGGTYAIVAGTTLNMATLGILDGGTQVNIASNETLTGALTLSGGTLDLDGHGLTVLGASTLNAGAAGSSGMLTLKNANIGGNFIMFGTSTLVDAGIIVQSGAAQLGGGATDSVTLTIGAGDTYDISAANWLGNPNSNDTGTSTITNAGLLEMTAGSGYATIWHSNITSTGTLAVTGGGLALDGGLATLSNSITGTGSLYLGDTWTLGAHVAVTVASLENGGAGTLDAAVTTIANGFTNDNGATINLNGERLNLTGAATLSGTIGGTGTLAVANATLNNFEMYGSATLLDAGTITQSGYTQLGGGSTDTVTLSIAAHDVYDITAANWLSNPNSNDNGIATITNAGLFEFTGTGTSIVWHTDFTNTGTLLTDATLVLSGQTASLAGTLSGPGWLALDTTWTLQPGAVVSVATLENGGTGNLTGAFAYSGTFFNDNGAVLDLHGNSLTLTGPATLSGSIGDGGTISASNASIGGLTVYGAATLIDTGVITQTGGSIDLGDNSADTVTLLVQAHDTYDVTVGAWIGNPNRNDTGTSTITSSGLFENTSTAAVDVWNSVFTSTGTVLSDGVLDFIGPSATLSGTLAGPGTIDLSTTWTLAAASTVTVGTLQNDGIGSLLGNVTLQGGLASDSGSALSVGAHTLTVDGTAALNGTISGTGALSLSADTATIGNTASITVASLRLLGGASVSLGENLSYGGGFIDNAGAATGTIDLGGHTLVLSGISTLTGSGGSTTIGDGTFTNSGSLTQSGKVILGDTNGAVAMTNAASAIWNMTVNTQLALSGTGSSIANAGLFEKTGGTGLAAVGPAFVNTGTVEVTSGTLEFLGGFTNSGTVIGTLTTSGGHTFITATHA